MALRQSINEWVAWLWAVICFIPAAFIVLVLFLIWYVLYRFELASDNSDARDHHSYLDYFDE